MDVSPRQMVSVASAMIPFLEHDDANRALMGANMQRQAVPLLRSESPLVAPAWSCGPPSTRPMWSSPTRPASSRRSRPTTSRHGRRRHPQHNYRLAKFARSNQGTSFNQKPIVDEGARVEVGQVVADGPSTDRARWRSARTCSWRTCRGGPQLRGRDHPQPAPGAGRRPDLDPHRGARGRRP